MENSGITAFILAGGKSQRMGADKGFLDWNGQSFVANIVAALTPIVGKNIVVVSSDERYDDLGLNRISDIVANKGPLGGIYSALKHTSTKRNLIVSVDVPRISTELIDWLVKKHTDAYQLTQLEVGEKPSPLVAIYDRSVRILLPEYIAGNQLKLRDFVKDLTHQTIKVPDVWGKQLENINTPEDYQNLKSCD
jgi:molybdenum cofactor guanylyltransferase